jgi:hypothetical protein
VVSIDSRTLLGPFEKTVLVMSDDPERAGLLLRLQGDVKALTAFDPGGYVALEGSPGKVPPEKLRLLNYDKKPLRITRSRSDLKDRIRWRIREIRAGYEFELVIEDRSTAPGEYTGRLILETDNPLKPELVVIVRGDVGEGGKNP